ncbi:MAG: thioesterase family protein [Myxococcota bacterium]|nr:thioesterase family protein [Myxococcota bacterium]
MHPDADAFYVPDGDLLVATPWTRGPWDRGAQHGGPPSALMARAIDLAIGEERDAWVPARTIVELLRPVPIAALGVKTAIESQGRRAIRAHASIEHGGVELARARVIFLRTVEGTSALERGGCAPLPAPESWPVFEFPFFLDPIGYHRAMEVRLEDAWPAASARAWSRMRVPLVLGEPTRGWERLLTFADAAHGVAPALDPTRYTIVNPDLEVSLTRRPEGEWIALDVQTWTTAIGTGVTRSTAHDTTGPIGAASATLVVRPRDPG